MRDILVYRIFNIYDMTEDLASRYFPLMSEGKRQKILNAADKRKAAQAFVADMLARQCLSEFCDAPEFSFSLLLNPGAKSIVSNFDAEICVSVADEFIGCAVSDKAVGISLLKSAPFTFSDAQKNLSDSEIRSLFSYSKYTFSELVNMERFDETSLQEKFALYNSLKSAQFFASGRGIRERKNNADFVITENGVFCSNSDFNVIKSEFIKEHSLAYSIVERCKK